MKKRFLCIAAAVLILILALAACSKDPKFDPDYLRGKTSAEIEEEFGEFDNRNGEKYNGLYHNTFCGYTVWKKDEGNEWLFYIYFDENGKAYHFSEGYRHGG